MTDLPSKADLLSALRFYDDGIRDERIPESELDATIDWLVKMVPHAWISDLMHSGDRERTPEEIVEEALIRERLGRENGEPAVRARMIKQFHEALATPDLPYVHVRYSKKMLQHFGEGGATTQ